MKATADLAVRNCGSVWQIFLLTDIASKWIEENVQTEAWQWSGNSIVVDWRFAEPLIDGARADGLEVRPWGSSQ